MKRFFATVAAASMAAATQAGADALYAVTPTGSAEMLFSGKPEDVIGQLSGKCIDAHWSVTSSTSTDLVCEAPMSFGQSLLGQMLMGNSYSTPPRRFFKFNAATIAGVSRVQASGWMELQMAFGQMKRTDFSGAKFENGMMNFMSAAGGKYPVGTTFPNHAYMGVQYKPESMGKTVGMTITAVADGEPAQRAGLLPGDTIVSIAGKKFKDNDDLLDAFEKAAKTPSYPVGILRSGKPMTMSVERAYKQASTEVVAPVATGAPSGAITTGPSSVADELTKLAKLKSDGLLTDAEFQAQKTKLLSK